MYSGVSVSGIIKDFYVFVLYEMLYTHADVDSNWKILQVLIMKTPYIYNIPPFLLSETFYPLDES
jgi:hypothetical protein